jgi:thiamine biosynthesis lipoprotein
MELDFGGFGKEYAADRAATLLMGAGFASGFVNLGGDIRLLGPRPDGSPWTLGIAHPRVAGGVIAELALTEGALATSGDYERYLEHAGQRYCHILDPHTGWPVSHWQSVSVVAPACLAAGALSTIAMLKQAQAPAFLAEQGVLHVLIDAGGQLQQHVWPLAED